jgi:hypothetical protein
MATVSPVNLPTGRRLVLPPALVPALMPAALAGALLLAAPALAGETGTAGITLGAEQLEAQQLTIYQNGSGLISERYRFQHPAGIMTLRLRQAPAALEPRSLQAVFDHDDIRLREQRLLEDLLTPRRLTEAAVGGPVTLAFTATGGGERQVSGTLLSAREGIVVRTADGILIQPEARLILPITAIPAASGPSLEWEVEAESRGTAVMDLTYLIGGLGWSADYVVTLGPSGDRADLTVWVTVENSNEIGYQGAALNLVAGAVRRVAPARSRQPRLMQTEAMSSRNFEESGFAQQKVGEVHLYQLGRQVDLPRHSVRQFILDAATAVPVRHRHVVSAGNMFLHSRGPGGEPRRVPVEARLEFTNATADGLGRPLPAGIARIFSAPPGEGRVFLGEDRLPATAVDESVSLVSGHSFDLVAERTQTDFQKRPGQRLKYEAAFRYDLRNRGSEGTEIDIRESIPGDWKLLESSHESSRPDAATLAFRVVVPAGREVSVSYRVKVD